MTCHIIPKQQAICQAVLAERLHHFVVVHLQSRVQNVNLVFLFTLILIDTEADGKKQKHTTDTQQ